LNWKGITLYGRVTKTGTSTLKVDVVEKDNVDWSVSVAWLWCSFFRGLLYI
jgi:hypothetical protein